MTMLRWATTITLITCLLAPLFVPIASADPTPQLPACCRRDGKHHCAMMAEFLARQQERRSETSFRREFEPCPYRAALLRTTSRPISTHRVITVSAESIVISRTVSLVVRPFFRFAFDHPSLRGPPSYFVQ